MPEVPELLDVPLDDGLPEPDGSTVLEDEPLDEPIPEDDPDIEPVSPGDPLAVPDEVAPVLPEVPELLDVPAVPLDAGALADGFVLSAGPTRPDAEPVAEPIPEEDPDAEPVAPGPEVVQAARVKAHAKGMIHLVIRTPF